MEEAPVGVPLGVPLAQCQLSFCIFRETGKRLPDSVTAQCSQPRSLMSTWQQLRPACGLPRCCCWWGLFLILGPEGMLS